MGFLVAPTKKVEVVEEKIERGRAAVRATRKVKEVTTGERGCEACSLRQRWPQLTTPRMPATIDGDKPDILVIGEAPGQTEDRKGEVFVGKTGSFLREQIPYRYVERMAFINAVRCRPSDQNDTPTPAQVHSCSVHTEEDIERYPIKAILGVGAVPLNSFVKGTGGILKIHGTRIPIQVGSKTLWYYPIFHPSFVQRMQGKYDAGPAYPVWRADIKRFLRDVDTWEKPVIHKLDPKKVIVPSSQDDARALIARMRGPIAVDIETSGGLRPYVKDARMITAAFSDGETTIAFPCDHPKANNPKGLELLFDTLETRHWLAHNASFELAWFVYYGAKLGRTRELNIFEDTMALARLAHQRESILALEVVSQVHLGTNVKQLSNLNTRRLLEYPLAEVLTYNGLDAMATAPIYHKLIREVNRDQYENLLERIESFTMMQLYGLPVNAKAAEAEIARWESLQQDASEEAHNLYEVKQFQKTYGTFNIGSTKMVGDALVEFGKLKLPRTDGGKQYKTDEEILLSLKSNNPLVTAVLKWREASKMKGTYAEPLRDIPKVTTDGRIHPCYTPLHVATYRSASEDPNAQNFPKRKHRELRKPVTAPDGHVVAAFDYGQLQVRILAMIAPDFRLIRDLIDEKDIHSYWLNNFLEVEPNYLDRLAQETNQTNEKDILKDGRNIIKGDFVFASFFGSGPDNISQRTGIDIGKIRELQAAFWEEYPDVLAWIKRQRKIYQEKGSVTGPNGLVRSSVLWGNEPINTPIQMGEAEIVLKVQSVLSRMSIQEGDFPLHPRINIHDDLTFILPAEPKRLMKYVERIAKEMVAVRFDWQICPLTVEVKTGPNWADLKAIEGVGLFTGDWNRGRGERRSARYEEERLDIVY